MPTFNNKIKPFSLVRQCVLVKGWRARAAEDGCFARNQHADPTGDQEMEASVCPTVLLVDIYGWASLSSRKLPTMYGPLTTKASSLAQPIACPCRQHGAGLLDITRQLTDNATYMRTEAPLLNGHPVQDVWWWWWWWWGKTVV